MKYITNFFRVGCVALLAMLILAPGAFSQAPTAPGVPTDVGVMPAADNHTDLILSWNAPATTGGFDVTSFRIEVSENYDAATPTAATWTDLQASLDTTTAASNATGIDDAIDGGKRYAYSHTGLDAGTERHYRVSATNVIGTGDPSGVESGTTKNVPDAITDLVAAATAETVGSITLNWTAPGDGGLAITGYSIQSSTDAGTTWGDEGTTAADVTTYEDTGLGAGAVLHYRVRATNSASNSDPTSDPQAEWSNVDDATAHDVPGAPQGLTAGDVMAGSGDPNAVNAGQNHIPLSWNTVEVAEGALPITGYQVEVLTVAEDGTTVAWAPVGSAVTTVETTHTGLDEALANPNTYYYRVHAINAAGAGDPSAVTSGVKLDVPGAPTDLIVRAVDQQESIDLFWEAPMNKGEPPVTSYRIERSDDYDPDDPTAATWETTTPLEENHVGRSYRDRGLTKDQRYAYRVMANNVVGTSATDAAPVDHAVSSNKALAPRNLEATVADNMESIVLTWDGPIADEDNPADGGSTITGYQIEVDDGTGWAVVPYVDPMDTEMEEKDEHPVSRLITSEPGSEFMYPHTKVASGTSYTYRVSAVNDAGPGHASDVATASLDEVAPGMPTGLTATAAMDAASIKLEWMAPMSNGGADITGYKIEVSEDAEATWADLDVAITETTDDEADPPTTTFSAVHTGLKAGATYHYRVSATNSVGTGDPTAAVSADAPDIPNAPTGLTATADGDDTINLSWTAPAAVTDGTEITGYMIESSPDGTDDSWTELVASQTELTYAHTGLAPETTVHYRVSAMNMEGNTGVASEPASATTMAAGVVTATRYAVSEDGSSDTACTNPAAPCTLEAALAASMDGGVDTVLVRIRRTGETATIGEDVTIDKMVTLGVYVRGTSKAAKGAVSFTGSVEFADGGDLTTHKDASIHFDELEVSGMSSIDKLTIREDLTISEDDEENTMTSVLAVDELTVNSGQTLTLGEGADVRVRLTKGAVGKMNGKLDVKGTIDGGGDLWVAHTSPERGATGFALHMPADYDPYTAIPPSKSKFTVDDCLMVTGGGTVENDLYFVAAGNVCVNLGEIGDLVAVGSISGQDDITTDVIFRNDVTVNGDVEQWNDARVSFEKSAMIDGDVTLDYGDGGVGTAFGTPNEAPADFERAMGSGLEFRASSTIEGDLNLKFDGTDGHTQVLLNAHVSGGYHMTTVEGDLIIEDGGGIHLHGHPGVRNNRNNNARAHNLSAEGDVFIYSSAEITQEHAATSTIVGDGPGLVCSAPGLNFGTKVMLSGDIVFTEGTTLTVATVVIADDVEVEEEGDLVATTVHVTADGELDSDGNTMVTDALVLEGDGLEGSLATGSTVNNITYATVDSDEIELGATVARLSVDVGADRELRISEAITITDLGLCSGTMVLIDTDTEANTLTVTDHLVVRDGYLSLDSNRPGSAGTDVSKPNAAATDGYILLYVTAGERMAGMEWYAPRKVAVNHKDAVIIVNEAKYLAEGVHLFNGHLHMKGEGSHLTVGTLNSFFVGLSPFVMVDNAELHSNGNNVAVHGTVRVATGDKEVGAIRTDGGELHVLGWNPLGIYIGGTAVATVGAGGTIDVGTGMLQLGPAYSATANGLAGPDRLDASLTVNKSDAGAGTVSGTIFVPRGSKETSINGEAFDTIILDATANPKFDPKGADNWGGGLYFHNSKVTIDSLAAMNDGAIEFYDQLGNADDSFAIEIKKDVELNSARIYVNQKNSLKFGGNLTFGETGGMRVWDDASVTVMGDFTQNKGSQHAGHQDGVGLAGNNTFTVMGDFMVADSAHRFESNMNSSMVLKGDFHFGMVMTGSDKMLNADLEFSGKEAQMVSAMPDLGNVLVNNSAGLVLSDSVSQGANSMLTLTSGVISSDMYSTWMVKNTGIEEDVRGRNNALTTCDDDENCANVITGGSRRAHATAGVSRYVVKGNSGEGETSGGYLFPVGGMSGDRAHYRPLILQLEDDLSEAMPVTVTPMMGSDDAGEINIVVPVQGGSLTLNAYADMFWKVETKEAPDLNPHIRVAASGLANVFDNTRLRMVQWDCDWSNARLAGMPIVGSDNASFAENGYVNGIMNLTQQSVEVGTCAILGIAANGIENPIHLDPLTGGIARIQFIHNLPLPFPVDLYLDGVKLMGGLNFRSATGYGHYAAGDHMITVNPVVPPGVVAAPIEIPLPSLVNEQNYAVIAHGSVANPSVKILGTKLRSTVDNMVEAILVHGSGDLGEVDVRVLDPADNTTPTKMLANNFSFDSATRYISLAPGAHNVQVTSPDNRTEVEVYYLDLNGYQGETLILNLSGGMDDLQLMGVRNNGDVFLSQMVTGVEEEGGPEIPTEFALHGNYPNPFNPSTRIEFDLPESAEVSLQVVDMLGRQVMTLPAQQVEAGANRTLELHATNLASGPYLYRIIAVGAEGRYVKTGRMMLVK